MALDQGLLSRRYRSSRQEDTNTSKDVEKGRTPDSDESKNTRSTGDGKVPWKERITHFTWAWFTFPMSTGGIALLLAQTPHRFTGLTTIGKVVYIYDLATFLLLTALILTRFLLRPSSLPLSLLHPTEALFFPTFFLALVIILMGAQAYGGPEVGSWFNEAEAKEGMLTVQSMTPGWILPIFPVMLCGTYAGAIAPYQTTEHAEAILVAGLTFQGLGWTVSFMMFALLLHRLMQYGLPAPNLRPGLFIAVGPPSFTSIALITITSSFPPESHYFSTRPAVLLQTIQSLAVLVAIFLWCLAFWFFSLALLSTLHGLRKMTFHLIWYGMIFPNVGFTLATIQIGKQLDSEGILWVSSAMTIVLVVVWLGVMAMHGEAVWRRRILMPGMDEDKDEYKSEDRRHGIPVPPSRPHSPHVRVRSSTR
ncbi:hypothetical protein PRZ48_013498 [Zasmidium cellare]|uniref:Malic acid transport protein n=1 Tax=Zasmidium cellare TaxID=395010 RepID=A0ABR0E1R2_ZASCE|nr:hypothetical protein PRZ48_013498 [Zasmidium cellare]